MKTAYTISGKENAEHVLSKLFSVFFMINPSNEFTNILIHLELKFK